MSTMGEVEYECPLCGEKFEYNAQFSYTTFGRNLDFKPFGAAFIPTPVPKCPKCGLVSDFELFTEDDINKLKEIFANNNIVKQEPNMPYYYYLAREFELLGKETDKIIDYYISAIWENSNYIPLMFNGKYVTEKWDKSAIFEKITNIIIAYFERTDDKNKNYYVYKLIKLDFLRRSKQFDLAKDLIEALKNDNNFPMKNYRELLDYQLKLIGKRDIDEHEMP